MNEKQAHKQAAKASKTEGAQFVVYVFDQGQGVYSAAQALMYQDVVLLEACYVSGVRVTSPLAELTRYACESAGRAA